MYPSQAPRRSRNAFPVILLAFAVTLAGCGTRPGADVLVPVQSDAQGARRVTVYAATSREPETENRNVLTSERAAETNYSRFSISIPPDHRSGRIEWPRAQPDAATAFVTLDRRALSEKDFLENVSAPARQGRRDISIFVHGYNQSFQEALFRLAQMTADGEFEGSSILFSWPSQAAVAGYVADRDSATYSRDHLAGLLTALAKDRRVGEITLMAHSMGAWLTVEALRQLRLTRQDAVLGRLQVVLASPDIDVDVFQAQMNVLGPMEPPLTVLVSPDDRALLVSRRLGGSHERVGTLDITDPRVQEIARKANLAIVDISSIEASDGLNHGRYASLASVSAQLTRSGAARGGQGLRGAGAFVFNAVGATISSPFTLVGEALAGD